MIVVVLPSRGRPKQARRAIAALRSTAVRVDTRIVLAVDEDDPLLLHYRVPKFGRYGAEVTLVTLRADETGDLTKATNTVALRIAEEDPDAIIGNLGDDHIARTHGWDRRIVEVLQRPGVAYGDDLYQHERLPTAPFISARIVLALGWYCLPALHHQFVDNVWKDIGRGIDGLTYLPDVVFEHVHPFAAKGSWDAGYERANAQEVIDHDGAAYGVWRERQMYEDIDRVREALRVPA